MMQVSRKMALSPLRKWLNVGFGLVLFVFVGALLWPLVSRPFELKAFCADLRPGVSVGVIRGLADEQGFRVSPASGGVAHVYDHQSLGKFSCTLRLQGQALIDASFVFNN